MAHQQQESDMTDADVLLDSVRRKSPVSRRDKVRRLIWSIVEATLFRYSFHTWSGWRSFLLRSFGAKIGRMCTIRRTARVYYPWLLEMGDMSCLGDNVTVYNLGKISLGVRATISQEAYLCAGTHDFRFLAMPLVTKEIQVGADAWICARAFVGPGVTIGEGAIVGAASVVVKSVEAWTINAGNPAKFIKMRERPI